MDSWTSGGSESDNWESDYQWFDKSSGGTEHVHSNRIKEEYVSSKD